MMRPVHKYMLQAAMHMSDLGDSALEEVANAGPPRREGGRSPGKKLENISLGLAKEQPGRAKPGATWPTFPRAACIPASGALTASA